MKCIGFTCGDCIGFPMEFNQSQKFINYKPFSQGSHYTDDTVMSIANMQWLIDGDLSPKALVRQMVHFGNKYPLAGYGQHFYLWLRGENNYQPYNSFGNGSGMRVSPIGWFFDNEEDVLKYAKISAEVTHSHTEGVKGAQAIAICIFLARTGHPKDYIKQYVEEHFGYDLDRTVEQIRPNYTFYVDCQRSVPESIICFLEAGSTLEAIQNAISLGGDTDTMACMAGAIAEAFYGDADDLFAETIKQIDGEYPDEFVEIIQKFNEKLDEKNGGTISW